MSQLDDEQQATEASGHQAVVNRPTPHHENVQQPGVCYWCGGVWPHTGDSFAWPTAGAAVTPTIGALAALDSLLADRAISGDSQ